MYIIYRYATKDFISIALTMITYTILVWNMVCFGGTLLHFFIRVGHFIFSNLKFYRLYPMVIVIAKVYANKQASALDFRCKLCINLY